MSCGGYAGRIVAVIQGSEMNEAQVTAAIRSSQVTGVSKSKTMLEIPSSMRDNNVVAVTGDDVRRRHTSQGKTLGKNVVATSTGTVISAPRMVPGRSTNKCDPPMDMSEITAMSPVKMVSWLDPVVPGTSSTRTGPCGQTYGCHCGAWSLSPPTLQATLSLR